LRLLFFGSEKISRLVALIRANSVMEHLKVDVCRRLLSLFLEAYDQGCHSDLLSCAIGLESEEEGEMIATMMSRKINPDKIEENGIETILRILQRDWLQQREMIKMQIHGGELSDEEALELAKRFDTLKQQAPQVIRPTT